MDLKILLISTRFFPQIGGVESVLDNLARSMAENNTVCVLTSKDSSFLDVSTDMESRDNYYIKRIWMAVPRKFMGYLAFPFRFLLSIYKLIRFIKDFKPDVINFHFMDDASIYVCILYWFIKTKLIISVHGNDLHVFSKNEPYKYFIDKLLNRADKVIVNSESMRKDFIDSYPVLERKVVIIPNGFDVNSVKKIKSKKLYKDPFIFFIGRLVHKKGVDILLKAFKEANIKDLKLVIEGSGEESNALKLLSKDLGISNDVKFMDGNLSNEEKFEHMKGSLFGVMPSRNEPFGVVALEFLAVGTPLIASYTGGLKDILKDQETCLFFENESVSDLVSKIKEMNNNVGLRMKLSTNGIEHVGKYSWKEISKKYMQVYNLNN